MKQKELDALLEDMSLEEKIDQLLQVSSVFLEKEGNITGPENTAGYTEEEVWRAGSVLNAAGAVSIMELQKSYMEKQPHHIPLLFMLDVINGYRTIFPIPLAQGCSFSPQLAKEGAAAAARESAAAGIHVTFSPMVDLVRDARWGRVMESTGEDPYLNGCFGRAMVEGYQGTDGLREKGRIAACVKHFAAYGAPVGGRDYNGVEVSERTLRDDYLPAYQEAVNAGAAMVMTSFQTLDRIPSTANKKLMREILRKDMGFQGVLISDWAAVEELCSHGVARDRKEAAKLAIEAGVDMDMMGACYCRYLKGLVEEGIVSQSLVDEAARRVLELKNKLGLFENPYKDADPVEEKTVILSDNHRALARKMAAESFVLLKNDGILPLKEKQGTIAFIGPHVSNREIFGAWSICGRAEDTVSLEDGIRNRGCVNVTFARGSRLTDRDCGVDEEEILLEEAVAMAAGADQVVLALGEHRMQSGEAASRGDITIPDCQKKLFERVCEANGNVVVVLFTGRPLDIREISEKAAAVLVVWMPGSEGGNAMADVLFGDVNPSGKLAMSFPYCVGQVPVCYEQFQTGRPLMEGSDEKYVSRYLDIPNTPLYPFGYGLSYTEFAIGSVRLTATKIKKNESLEALVSVRNTGNVKGQEVVQLYLQDIHGSVVRPLRQLKGFQKVELEPGEEKKITFEITEEMLRFHDINMEYVSEPGMFRVYLGNSSETDNAADFVLSSDASFIF